MPTEYCGAGRENSGAASRKKSNGFFLLAVLRVLESQGRIFVGGFERCVSTLGRRFVMRLAQSSPTHPNGARTSGAQTPATILNSHAAANFNISDLRPKANFLRRKFRMFWRRRSLTAGGSDAGRACSHAAATTATLRQSASATGPRNIADRQRTALRHVRGGNAKLLF